MILSKRSLTVDLTDETMDTPTTMWESIERPRRWRRRISFDFMREKQVSALWLAALVLLATNALVLQRCYYSCVVSTERLRIQVYDAFTAHNSSQRIHRRGDNKGPFRSWKEARQALRSIRQRDIQLEIGAPLNELYRDFRLDEESRLGHLPPPPTQCIRFYDDDSPAKIDLALVRMLGQSKSKIPTNLVRNVSFAIHASTNYTTRFPLDKSITTYVLKDGKLHFDKRSNHPRSCGHQHKIVGFMAFMHEAVRRGLSLPDVAFRFSCLDNPYSPFQGLWTYSSFKDGREGPLAFPDDYFTFERWKRLRPDRSEPSYRSKASRAAWFGGKTGDVPLHHASRQGFLDVDYDYDESTETMTPREYFVSRYSPGNDERIVAAFDKLPMSTLLGRYRVLLAIAGHSYASNTLPLLFSNSLVVEQDYPVASWEDHFFLPGVHFLTIPRNMDDGVLQAILDLVEKPENDDYFTNMTRLAATVAELVVDPLFCSCYTHRALQHWSSRMEEESLSLDENMVEIVDFFDATTSLWRGSSRFENFSTPKQLLKRAFHTRVHSGFLGRLWESVLIWWWDIDYNATTYM